MSTSATEAEAAHTTSTSMDMNLAASESDPNPKRCRMSKPRVGMIFRDREDEYFFYLVDFNSAEKLKVNPNPVFRFKFGPPSINHHRMCMLGSTLYIFESGFPRSVFSFDLSRKDSALQTLPLCLLWPKKSHVAIPTPKKNGDILVFSTILVDPPAIYKSSGFTDFEVYNPLTGTRRPLPFLHGYIEKAAGCRPHFVSVISSYAFLSDGRFFVQLDKLIFAIDIESDHGWHPIQTCVLVKNWGHFHSFHDDFWLTREEGFYINRGPPMFAEGAPRYPWVDDDFYYDDVDDGDDGVHRSDFRFPFLSDIDENNTDYHRPRCTFVGDSTYFCTMRSSVKMYFPHFQKIAVDMFEFDADKMRSGYDQGGCRLVSSVEHHIPFSNRDFMPIALLAIDDHCSIAPAINVGVSVCADSAVD